MKKFLLITLCALLTLGLFVSCDADAEEKVFEKQVAETEVTYAKLLGSVEGQVKVVPSYTNKFGEVIGKAVNAYISKGIQLPCTIKFLANQPFEPTEFIISTEDSPYKAWVEIEETTKEPQRHLNILIKTNADKFLANECCYGLFTGTFENFTFGIWVKAIEFNNVFDTSKTTNMAEMFSSVKVETLDLSCFDTSNVTDMSHMFDLAEIKNTLDLSSFNTINVKNMSRMFEDTVAEALDLSNFNTSNVTNMDCMFDSMAITAATIDISSFDTNKVLDFRSMLGTESKTYIVGENFVISEGANEIGNYIDDSSKLQGPQSVLEALNPQTGAIQTHKDNAWSVTQNSGLWYLGRDN